MSQPKLQQTHWGGKKMRMPGGILNLFCFVLLECNLKHPTVLCGQFCDKSPLSKYLHNMLHFLLSLSPSITTCSAREQGNRTKWPHSVKQIWMWQQVNCIPCGIVLLHICMHWWILQHGVRDLRLPEHLNVHEYIFLPEIL